MTTRPEDLVPGDLVPGDLVPGDLVPGDAADVALQSIDVLLEQGTPAELQAMRRRIAEDPEAALEFADTVALIEQLRSLRTATTPELPGKLYALSRRAARRQPQRSQAGSWLMAAAAAVVGFGATAVWDMLRGHRDAAQSSVAALAEPAPAAPQTGGEEPVSSPVPTVAELAQRDAVGAMRRRFELESATHIAAALESAVNAERDPLASWLAPRNALAIRKLDHELRTHPEIRLRALRSEGAMLAADQRAQGLADGIAAALREGVAADALTVRDVSLAVRALIAAGVRPGPRERALRAGSDWLAARLSGLYGEERVRALGALVESAAVDADHRAAVAAAGEELIDSVLLADDETWERRRPELLSERAAHGVLGDAGHTLALLPALGADPGRCAFVRTLLLGELRDRRDREQDGPELLAAMLYGFGDLLSERERDAIVLQVRRWKPARLAPDFETVQQIAWGVEPGYRGFTRLQRELRQLVILPDPEGLAARAALCLSLTSNYAAQRPESLERFAAGE